MGSDGQEEGHGQGVCGRKNACAVQASQADLAQQVDQEQEFDKDPPPLKDGLPVIFSKNGRLNAQQDTVLEQARMFVRCSVQNKKGVSYTPDPKAAVPAKEKRKPPKDDNGSDEEDRSDEGTQPPKGATKPRKSRKKNSVFIPDGVADLPTPGLGRPCPPPPDPDTAVQSTTKRLPNGLLNVGPMMVDDWQIEQAVWFRNSGMLVDELLTDERLKQALGHTSRWKSMIRLSPRP
ncbi:hypothetical protein IWZ01DRAFT_246877 [Phyllosticta capitalensis]